ncbi:MAG: DUF2231 domain-containing protein [Campylobacterales bacterium]
MGGLLGSLHPFFVHFAVALPIVAFVLDLGHRVRGSEVWARCAMIMMIAGALMVALAFFSGHFAEESVESFLSPAAKELFETHEVMGKVVMGLMLVLAVARLYLGTKEASYMRSLYLGALAIVIALILYQGKVGGELVYEHGVGTVLMQQSTTQPYMEEEER